MDFLRAGLQRVGIQRYLASVVCATKMRYNWAS
jgi:hypothetical protein